MKKKIFTLSLIVIFTAAYGQKNLRAVINAENGITKHFTKLEENQQIAFSPLNAKSVFGLDINSDLVLLRAESDNAGMTHYRYYQSYKGIPVENSMYIVHTLKGRLTSMSGTVVTQFTSAMNDGSLLSAKQAIERALNYVHAEKYAWEDKDFEERIKIRNGDNATYYPSPVKIWYSGEEDINPHNLRLTYKIDVYSLQPLDRKYVYVDAQSGEISGTSQILKHIDTTGTALTGYSGAHTLHSDFTGSRYRLRDYTKGNGIFALHASAGHRDYTSKSRNFSYSNADTWALDAQYGVTSTWKFYKNNFNRNSIDNNGYTLISWVNDASVTDNAVWDGAEMRFGNLSANGNGVVGIDIAGHELTHGVTERTSQLIYSREPGAMNESMSDIMGKSVQFYTKPYDSSWVLSNDMGWELRDFSNPNVRLQPDTYKGNYWDTSSFDNYGVHINSGVGNYMFYLLVKGGTGTNDIGYDYEVTGIGLAKADQIIYRTNTTYLTSTSQYADWRVACIQAAADLYGAASEEVKQVKNAWFAVGIGVSGSNNGISYCASKGVNSNFEYINKVALGSISNTSGNDSGYKSFTNLSTNLTAGKTYNITLTPGYTNVPYPEFWTVYIDYNNDGTLNGTGEIAATGNGTTPKTLSFTVPANAKADTTRMRIQMHYGAQISDPCAAINFGEVEDYSVIISAPDIDGSLAFKKPNVVSAGSMTIGPNPAHSFALINYRLAEDGKAAIRVMDMSGRLLRDADLGFQKTGSHTYHLDNLNTLAGGNYIVILQQNNKIIERKHLIISK